MSGRDQIKVSSNDESDEGLISKELLKLVKLIIDKSFLLLIPVAVVIVASQVFSNPDFAICSNPTYINFTIEAGLVKANNDFWQGASKSPNYTKTISISAYNLASWNKYNFPIFLNWSFIDECGRPIKNVTQIDVVMPNRELKSGGKGENAIITLEGNPLKGNADKGEYNLRFWGRGGGGEGYYYVKTDLESARTEWTGKEPIHFCTVTILIETEKPRLEKSKSNNSR